MKSKDNDKSFDFASVLLVAGFMGLFIYKRLFDKTNFGNPSKNFESYSSKLMSNR